jgi:integrase
VSTSRRRDAGSKSQGVDPVRVSPDGRIAYWTGGTPGVGERKFERRSDPDAAKTRADELRAALAAKVDPSAHRTLDELAQTMLDEMRESGTPNGTTRQYKSNWNVWVPPEVGATLCGNAGIEHVTAILRGLGSKKASRGTVNAVIRTLNTVTRTGHLYGWLAADGLGSDRLRQSAYKVARHRASGTDEAGATITLDKCPTVTEVDEFAAAMAVAYPGYGDRLVHVAFSSGVRLCEALALTVHDVNLAEGTVRIERQLDRYGTWPDTAPPKGGKPRTAVYWASFQDTWASLVADARTAGRDNLFPRHRSTTKFADRVGVFCKEARDTTGATWGFHWLRHAYATWSLAREEDGGYALDLASVSKWLGHHKTSLTQDLYVSPVKGHSTRAREVTRRPVGQKPANEARRREP